MKIRIDPTKFASIGQNSRQSTKIGVDRRKSLSMEVNCDHFVEKLVEFVEIGIFCGKSGFYRVNQHPSANNQSLPKKSISIAYFYLAVKIQDEYKSG